MYCKEIHLWYIIYLSDFVVFLESVLKVRLFNTGITKKTRGSGSLRGGRKSVRWREERERERERERKQSGADITIDWRGHLMKYSKCE